MAGKVERGGGRGDGTGDGSIGSDGGGDSDSGSGSGGSGYQLAPGEILVFTASITTELEQWLTDDYNYEMAVRAVGLRGRAAINNVQDHGMRVRKIVAALLPRIAVNIVHQWERRGRMADADVEIDDTIELSGLLTAVEMAYNSHGKPAVAGLHFNASSSNDVVCVAVRRDLEIGVDLSHARQNITAKFMDEFKGIFGGLEYVQMMAYPREQRYVAFNQLWTLKESFTKYLGLGLNVELDKFWFEMGGREVADIGPDSTDKVPALPHRVSVPNKPPGGFCSEYTAKWSENIPIHSEELGPYLPPDITPLIARKLTCRSCLLMDLHQNQLPVIMSIITAETANFSPKCFHINVLAVLRSLSLP